jgi:hypothetical protein
MLERATRPVTKEEGGSLTAAVTPVRATRKSSEKVTRD